MLFKDSGGVLHGIVDTDGDGWREYNGEKLSYVATCPNGWSDWQAAIEVIGQERIDELADTIFSYSIAAEKQ